MTANEKSLTITYCQLRKVITILLMVLSSVCIAQTKNELTITSLEIGKSNGYRIKAYDSITNSLKVIASGPFNGNPLKIDNPFKHVQLAEFTLLINDTIEYIQFPFIGEAGNLNINKSHQLYDSNQTPINAQLDELKRDLQKRSWSIRTLEDDFQHYFMHRLHSEQELWRERNNIIQKRKEFTDYYTALIREHLHTPMGPFLLKQSQLIKLDYDFSEENMIEEFKVNKANYKFLKSAYGWPWHLDNIFYVGSIIPDFTVRQNGDIPFDFYPFIYKNELTLIEFWASWCGPCIQVNKDIAILYEQYKDKGFAPVSFNVDKMTDQSSQELAKRFNITWTSTYQDMPVPGILGRVFTVTSVPVNYLINNRGKIVAKNLRGEELKNFVTNYFTKVPQ